MLMKEKTLEKYVPRNDHEWGVERGDCISPYPRVERDGPNTTRSACSWMLGVKEGTGSCAPRDFGGMHPVVAMIFKFARYVAHSEHRVGHKN